MVDPTAGFVLTLNQEFAALGGEVTHSKTIGNARVYATLFDEDLVLSAELEGGAIFSQQGTRITDRFSTAATACAASPRDTGVGPRDFCDQCRGLRFPTAHPHAGDVDSEGGGRHNYYGVLRLDASFPLGIPEEYGLYTGMLFADAGWLPGPCRPRQGAASGPVDDAFHMRSAVGVELSSSTRPSRRCASTTRSRSRRSPTCRRTVPVVHPDPVLTGDGGPARARGMALGLMLAGPVVRGGAGPGGGELIPFHRPGAAPDQLQPGPALFADEERERDTLRNEARKLNSAFEEEERRLTEQRPTLPPEEFRKLSDAFDARVVKARRDQDERASALAQQFDQRRRQFYAQVAPILVMLMDRYGAKAIFDENSVLLADQTLNITEAVIAEIDANATPPASGAEAPSPADPAGTTPAPEAPAGATGEGGQ